MFDKITFGKICNLTCSFDELKRFNSKILAWSYFFYDENNTCVGGGNITTGLIDVYVKVPSDAVYIGVLYNPRNPYGVYQAS